MIYEQTLGPIGDFGSSIVWLVGVTVTAESTAGDHMFELIPTIWSDVFLPADASSTCMRICTCVESRPDTCTSTLYLDRSDGDVIDSHCSRIPRTEYKVQNTRRHSIPHSNRALCPL